MVDKLQLFGSASLVLGSIVATAAIAIKTANQRKPKPAEDIYGSARFMTGSELQHSGLLVDTQARDADGIYLGGYATGDGTVRYLRDASNGHVLICGPTRSGKSVSSILPTLLSWRGAAIINDEKGELFEQTSPFRARHIGPIVKWEPGALTGSAAWNPLSEIRLSTPHEVADAQNIALMLIDIRGHGLDRLDHWQKAAVPLLAGMILHELYDAQTSGRIACMGDVTTRFADPTASADDLFEEMRDNRHNNGAAHALVAGEGRAQLNRSDRERSGVTSTLRTYLTLFADEIVAANTSVSDFRLADIADGDLPMSIYVTTLPDDSVRLRPLVRLFMTTACRTLMTPPLRFVDGQPVNPHRFATLICLDEFPSYGRMEEIESALSRCASWGIKFLLAIQDLTQLNGIYGIGHSIVANMHTRAFFPTNDLSTAEILSRSTGVMTVQTPHTTITGRRFGMLGNMTQSIQPTARPLLTPGEILAMKAPIKDATGRILEPGDVLIFCTGHRPLQAKQMLYFEDPEFCARALA